MGLVDAFFANDPYFPRPVLEESLYKIFKEKDATQIEINPLGETADGHVLWCVVTVYSHLAAG